MDVFFSIVTNYVLICSIIAWFAAQVIKCITFVVKHHRFDFRMLVSSGGMPSSHSAIVTSMMTATAKVCGAGSPEFAIALIFSFVVMYDACGVRRAAGEQAKVLNRIVDDIGKGETKYLDKNLKELIGHTPIQVFAGAAFGIAVALLIPVF